MRTLISIALLSLIFFKTYSQDTIKGLDYLNLKTKTTSYLITDDYKNIYKRYNKKKNKEYILIENISTPIEKIIVVDKTIKGPNTQITDNDELLTSYYQKHIVAPKHSGDPNRTIISLLVNHIGQIVKISILENVKNRCDDKPWNIELNKNFRFKVIPKQSKKSLIEYVLKIDAICYCECNDVNPEFKSGN